MKRRCKQVLCVLLAAAMVFTMDTAVIAAEGISENVISENTVSENIVPEDSISYAAVSEDIVSEDAAPEVVVSDDSTSENEAAETVSEDTAVSLDFAVSAAAAGSVEESDNSFDLSEGDVTISKNGEYTITQGNAGTATEHTILISADCTVTLAGVNIVTKAPSMRMHTEDPIPNPINISGNYHVSINLAEGSTNTLKAGTDTLETGYGSSGMAAIRVPSGAMLTISGEGTLNAYGADGRNYGETNNSGSYFNHGGGGAGIGGNGGLESLKDGTRVSADAESSGTVIINGGTLNISGGNGSDWGGGGAGIGGGGARFCDSRGLDYYGIGGNGGAVTVNGGTVNVTAGCGGNEFTEDGDKKTKSGYAIGGGGNSVYWLETGGKDNLDHTFAGVSSGTITLNGGTLTAQAPSKDIGKKLSALGAAPVTTGLGTSYILRASTDESGAGAVTYVPSAYSTYLWFNATKSIVNSVAVTPATAAALRGGASIAFTSAVSGTGDPSTDVTWSISENHASGTVINSDGTFTAALNEPASKLTIVAASTQDPSKYGTATVTLKTVYTVSYNANGGSGSMAKQTMTVGEAASLLADQYVQKGYIFAGWNTKADGSGTSYTNRQSVTDLTTAANTTVTLYAVWREDKTIDESITSITPPELTYGNVTFYKGSNSASVNAEYMKLKAVGSLFAAKPSEGYTLEVPANTAGKLAEAGFAVSLDSAGRLTVTPQSEKLKSVKAFVCITGQNWSGKSYVTFNIKYVNKKTAPKTKIVTGTNKIYFNTSVTGDIPAFTTSIEADNGEAFDGTKVVIRTEKGSSYEEGITIEPAGTKAADTRMLSALTVTPDLADRQVTFRIDKAEAAELLKDRIRSRSIRLVYTYTATDSKGNTSLKSKAVSMTVNLVSVANGGISLTSKGNINLVERDSSYTKVTPKMSYRTGITVKSAEVAAAEAYTMNGGRKTAVIADASSVFTASTYDSGIFIINAASGVKLNTVKDLYVPLTLTMTDGSVKNSAAKVTLVNRVSRVKAGVTEPMTFYLSDTASQNFTVIKTGKSTLQYGEIASVTLEGAADTAPRAVRVARISGTDYYSSDLFTYTYSDSGLRIKAASPLTKNRIYSLQFRVKFRDQAANAKDTVVRFRVRIR